MTEGTRSFNAKRSRLTAAEVRRKVLEGSYIAGNQPESFDPNAAMSASTQQRIILADIANPVDVEEALSSRVIARTEIKAISSSPQRIRDLTEKDVDIVVIPRNKSISNPAVFEALSSDSVETQVKDLIVSYEKDFTVVERRYESFSSAESHTRMSQQRKQIAEINPKQIFENDTAEIEEEAPGRIPLRSVSQVGDHPHGNRESTISIESNGSSGSKDDSQSQQLHASTCDPIVPNVTLKLSRIQIDEANEKKRHTNRSNYLINLLPLESETEVIEKRPKISCPTESTTTQRLVVRLLKLNLDPFFEPLFASAALYDINEKKKLSENFYFDLNSEDLLSLVRGHLGCEEEASKCRQAMFSVTDIRPGLFIVFKLEKILQSCDIGEAIEPYIKEEKNKEKLCQNAKEYCSRLGNYRMPFGWAALDLNAVLLNAANLSIFDIGDSVHRIDEELESIGGGSSYHETESIISADRISTMTSETLQHTASSATITSQILDTPSKKRSFFTSSATISQQQQAATVAAENIQQRISKIESLQPLLVNVNSFYKQDPDRLTDDELIKTLTEARKSNSSKLGRLKAIPIELKLELSLMKLDEIPAKLSTELIPMQPFVREISDPLTKDILPFAKAKDFTVNTFYRNLLYIHPKHVNFSARPGNARNICIRMQLMDSHSKPLKVIFGKSSTSNYSDKSYSSVLYHNKSPQFGDETKLQLPVDLNDGHHILFTFLHISCKPGKQPSETLETPIGYTWHPLYRNGQLQTGEFALPISLESLPSSICYLSPFVNVPSIKWLDSHKPLFQVSISAVSTIHPQDEFLANFFTTFQALKSDSKKPNQPIPTESRMIDVVKGVIKAPPQPLANFLYAILDRILTLIGCQPFTAALTQACFETLCHLVKVCTMLLDNSVDSLGRSQLLTTYLNYYKITTSDCLKGGQDMDTRKTAYGSAPLAGFEDIISSPRNSARDSVDLINVIKNYERKTSNKLLASVEETQIDGDRKFMHEEIAAFLVKSTGSIRETISSFSWFFLELIYKAMSEYLGACNRFFLPRKLRFRDTFLQNIHHLVTILINDVIEKLIKDPRQAKSVNASLGFFLRDSLSLMDRSFSLQLIRDYLVIFSEKLSQASSEISQTSLMSLRIAFLRIICSHEHFTIINLPFDLSPTTTTTSSTTGTNSSSIYQSPFKTSNSSFNNGINAISSSSSTSMNNQAPPSPSGSSSLSSRESSSHATDSQCPSNLLELSSSYKSKHFLLGVVLSDLSATLHSTNSTAQAKTIALVKTLLATHETDLRLSDSALKNRVASLYLPLIGILMDVRQCLFDPYGQCLDGTPVFPRRTKHSPGVNPKVALAISGLSHSDSTKHSKSAISHTLSKDLTQQLLICFCWVIKNIDKSTLKHWMRELSPQRVHQFVDLLQLCISCFEYDPSKQTSLGSTASSAVVDSSAACNMEMDETLIMKSIETSSLFGGGGEKTGGTIRWRMDEVGCLSRKRKTTIYSHPSEVEIALEKQVATEVTLITVDTMETLLKVLAMPASDHLHYLRPILVRLLMHIFACHQSVQSLESVFATQRSIVANYASLIFEERTELCAELCLQLLRHLASRLPTIRSNAAASLYLLMRNAFEHSSSFSKVKMQITMSLSTLVSNASSYGFALHESNLRRSLKTLLTYLENDLSVSTELQKSSFATQTKDLVFNLHMILSDTVKMKNVSNDFEMLIDLMFRIAKGYQTNPDLRLTWLINIANKHAERENYAEAAQCILHCAALVVEYLSMRSFGEFSIPKGAVAFEELSENILEESATSDDVISPDNDGVCESAHFSIDGFVHLIEKVASFYEKAQMFELLPNVYKLILPLYEERNDFTRLAHLHQHIADQLKKVEPPVSAILDVADAFPTPLPGSDKRCFGTYFRVGFYGYRFGDLNGEEFVYKEPAITKLSEISHRLEGFYAERLGKSNVEVIKDSNDVDPRRLNPEKAYLQITYVEPHLEVWERRRRGTHLQSNYKLRHFSYATPFTKDGKAHGELKDQFKRRTILTTQYSFPYLKTRLRVIGREQTTLSPIEVAIEDIQKKTRELTAVLFAPPDAKMLQMVLQGCIGTTVNVGPVQIAKVFLSNMSMDERGKPRDKLQNKLRLCFKDFTKKCSDALAKNEQLIGADQTDYQRELRRNFAEYTSQLYSIIGIPSSASSTSMTTGRTPLASIQLQQHQQQHSSPTHHHHSNPLAAIAADLGPVTAV